MLFVLIDSLIMQYHASKGRIPPCLAGKGKDDGMDQSIPVRVVDTYIPRRHYCGRKFVPQGDWNYSRAVGCSVTRPSFDDSGLSGWASRQEEEKLISSFSTY